MTGKPVWGPLSKAVANAAADKELNMSLLDQFGNMMLILFAGLCCRHCCHCQPRLPA